MFGSNLEIAAMLKRRRSSMRVMNEHLEARVVHNIALAVDDYVAGLTKDARFLNETEIESSIAVFHSSEIVLGRLLGSGGFSQVFEARGFNLLQTQPSAAQELNLARRIVEGTAVDHRGRARYALKHLDQRLLQNPDEFCAAAADLLVEAKYMSRFNHPNILRLRGMSNGGTAAFKEGRYNSFFLLTDRLTHTLDKRIEQWSMEGHPRRDMIVLKTGYAFQIASALEYLHERRIIYRDLKPQNIGFKEDDTIQLFDFGLCRELPEPQGFPDETFKMSDAGTRRYMSPEIYLSSTYNLKSDVYSWALVTYQLFSHETPYAHLSDGDFQAYVVGQGLRPKIYPYELPHTIEHVIQKAWSHHISQRPTMREVRKSLQALFHEWEGRRIFSGHSHQPITFEDLPEFESRCSEYFGCPQQQTPVFTFEDDLGVCFEKKNTTSAEVTLPTEASTNDLDEQSISTFDYSLSSLMDLEEDLSAPHATATMALYIDEPFDLP
jgi:serine/threonine protein kinase